MYNICISVAYSSRRDEGKVMKSFRPVLMVHGWVYNKITPVQLEQRGTLYQRSLSLSLSSINREHCSRTVAIENVIDQVSRLSKHGGKTSQSSIVAPGVVSE